MNKILYKWFLVLAISLTHLQVFAVTNNYIDTTNIVSSDNVSESPWKNDSVAVMNDSLINAQVNAISSHDTVDGVFQKQKNEIVEARIKNISDGIVKGIVIAEDTKKSIPKVSIRYELKTKAKVSKQSIFFCESDIEGMYNLHKIPEGNYAIKVFRKGYLPYEVENVIIKKSGEVREIILKRRMLKGRLVKVHSTTNAGSDQMLMQKRKQGSLVMEGLSADQISKSTDSDAGSIAKRITGTSLVGGKYVFVRGLGERYTNMSLNGLPVPSPEKDKRVVPQDLFPASALESFAIYKTFSPELSPDFAGGSVALNLKGIPDENFYKVGVGVGTRFYPGQDYFWAGSRERLTYDGGSGFSNYIGIDDGTRAIPNGVPEIVTRMDSVESRSEWASKFNNKMSVDTSKTYPDQSLSLSWGRVKKIDNNARWGGMLGLTFKNKYISKTTEKQKVYTSNIKSLKPQKAYPDADCVEEPEKCYMASVKDTVDGVLDPLLLIQPGIIQNVTTGEYSTKSSLVGNVGYESRNNILWFKTLMAHIASDKTIYNMSQVIPGTNGSQDDPIEERFLLEFNSRNLFIGQFGGGHFIGKSILDSVSWALGLAYTSGETPDSKKYNFTSGTQKVILEKDTIILGEKYFAGDTAKIRSDSMRYDIRSPYGSRSWEKFYETGFSGRFDAYLIAPPEWSRPDTILTNNESSWVKNLALPKVMTGFLFNIKNRDYDMIRYDWDGIPSELLKTNSENFEYVSFLHDPYIISDNILETGTGFKTTPKDFDTYYSSEKSIATYVKMDLGANFWNRLPIDFHGGIRYELFKLDFTAPYTGEEDKDTSITINELENQLYPFAGVDFEFFQNTKTRFYYSKTMVRPEIRERAPTFFFDTEEEIEVIGNPDLKNTNIYHYDIRFDWFLKYGQLISASVFYKYFIDPIESIIDGNLSPERKRFQNAKSAYSRGFEVELDLNIEKIFSKLKGWSIYSNAAFIQSQVEIDTSQVGASLLTSSNRSMMGQSPFLINVKLKNERTIKKYELLNGLFFNVAGRRISSLGVDGVPDIYEEAFPSLDFMTKVSWNSRNSIRKSSSDSDKGKKDNNKIGHSFTCKFTNILNSSTKFTVTDFHSNLSYQTIDNDYRDELYKDIKNVYVIKEEFPGVSISASYSIKF